MFNGRPLCDGIHGCYRVNVSPCSLGPAFRWFGGLMSFIAVGPVVERIMHRSPELETMGSNHIGPANVVDELRSFPHTLFFTYLMLLDHVEGSHPE